MTEIMPTYAITENNLSLCVRVNDILENSPQCDENCRGVLHFEIRKRGFLRIKEYHRFNTKIQYICLGNDNNCFSIRVQYELKMHNTDHAPQMVLKCGFACSNNPI